MYYHKDQFLEAILRLLFCVTKGTVIFSPSWDGNLLCTYILQISCCYLANLEQPFTKKMEEKLKSLFTLRADTISNPKCCSFSMLDMYSHDESWMQRGGSWAQPCSKVCFAVDQCYFKAVLFIASKHTLNGGFLILKIPSWLLSVERMSFVSESSIVKLWAWFPQEAGLLLAKHCPTSFPPLSTPVPSF